MTTWKFSDGSILKSGGKVTGAGKAAAEMRGRFGDPDDRVGIFPEPMRGVPMDRASDYMLDVFALEVAWATRTKVVTTYERDEDDLPKELRERWRAFREGQMNAPFGRIY
jgi:hypothetical protein